MADRNQNSQSETRASAAVKNIVEADVSSMAADRPALVDEGKSKPLGNRRTSDHSLALKESDNRFTSPNMVLAFKESFGGINFDPCWHKASAVQPDAYLDIRKGQDGLIDDWQGPVAFVNPPWSLAKKFLERGFEQWQKGHVTKVVCLVPAKTDTTFFHTVLREHADVYFVEKRLRFFQEDGTSKTTAESVMIVMFGASLLDKARFAARVPGSWWLPPEKVSRPPQGEPPRLNNPFSCSAASQPGGNFPKVFCAKTGNTHLSADASAFSPSQRAWCP